MNDEVAPIETKYDGRRFRSRTEARWAVFFNAMGWGYEYEREGYDLDGTWYLPDFFLPAFPLWVEVKGATPTDGEKELAKRLALATGLRVLIFIGQPVLGAARFFYADASGKSGDCQFLADRRNEGEFWIALGGSEASSWTETFSIGPVDGPKHDRYPVVSEQMEKAFDAASSARFEHGEES